MGWWRREGLRDGERRQRLGATVYVNFVPTVHHRGNKRKQLHRRQVQFVPRYYKKGGTRRRKKKNKKEENREETKTRGYRQKRGLMGRDKMVGRMRRKEVTSTKQTTYHSTAVALIYYGIYSQIRCLSVCVCVCVCFVARTFSLRF